MTVAGVTVLAELPAPMRPARVAAAAGRASRRRPPAERLHAARTCSSASSRSSPRRAASSTQAGLYVVLGGIADALDGRVARATEPGSRFGEELDSLVDAISFGLAPAMIMYFAVLNRDGLGLDLRASSSRRAP